MPNFNKHESAQKRSGWLASEYTKAALNLQDTKRHQTAELCLREGYSRFPDDSRLANMLGKQLRSTKTQDMTALACFQRSVDLNPTNVLNRLDLADLQAKMGRLDEAVHEFFTAIRIGILMDSHVNIGLNKLGHTYFLHQLYQDATDAFGLSRNVDPSNDVAIRRLCEMEQSHGLVPLGLGMKRLEAALMAEIHKSPARDAVINGPSQG